MWVDPLIIDIWLLSHWQKTPWSSAGKLCGPAPTAACLVTPSPDTGSRWWCHQGDRNQECNQWRATTVPYTWHWITSSPLIMRSWWSLIKELLKKNMSKWRGPRSLPTRELLLNSFHWELSFRPDFQSDPREMKRGTSCQTFDSPWPLTFAAVTTPPT